MDTKKISEISIIFIGFSIVIFLLEYFQSFLRPLAIALTLSFLFTPLFKLSKKQKIIEIAKIVLSIIFLITLIGIFSASLVNGIFDQNSIKKIDLNDLTITIGENEIFLLPLIDTEKLIENMNEYIKIFIKSISSFFQELFLTIIFMIFLIPSINIWIRRTIENMNSNEEKNFMKTILDIEKGIKKYLGTKTIISLSTALISLIVMVLFGVDNFLLFSMIIFAFNFIPAIGSIIAVAIALFIEFMVIGFGLKFLALAFLLISIQMIFGNIIEPKFTGDRLKLSPLIILISLFFWGAIWGIGGMIFSIPLTLVIKIFLSQHSATKDIVKYIS